jgi:hypothetical protein
MNDTNNVGHRPHPIRALGLARRPREDGPKKGGTKQAKQVRMATSPTEDATKTRALQRPWRLRRLTAVIVVVMTVISNHREEMTTPAMLRRQVIRPIVKEMNDP